MDWSGALGGLGSVVNTGLGLLMEKHNDKRQITQQQKLTDQQIVAQRKMADYNKQIALDMWEKTNYQAQVEQMKKAGLNVGLMYGQGGGGGTTTSSNAGAVSAPSAQGQTGEIGMAMQLGLQQAMQQATIELTKAQTEKTKAETSKTAGVDTQEALSRIDVNNTNIKNTEAETKLTEFKTKSENLDIELKEGTLENNIKARKTELKTLETNLDILLNQKKISNETYQEAIKQAKLETTFKTLQNELTKTQTDKTKSDIQVNDQSILKMAEEVVNMQELRKQGETRLANEKEQLLLNKIENEFGTGSQAKTLRIIHAITQMIGAIGKYIE